jgi:hypothetical protein
LLAAAPAAAIDRRAEAAAKDAIKRAAKDYRAASYAAAAARLDRAARACGATKCSTATTAAVLRDLGTMQLRSGDVDGAKKTWESALKLDANLSLNPDYDAPDLRAAFEDAKGVAPGPPPEGDFVHTPPAEQKANGPLPLHVELPGTTTPARVVVKYKGPGAHDWSVVDLHRVGGAWEGVIPCADVTRGMMRYWIQGFDAAGDPIANSGDPKHPFTVSIKDDPTGRAACPSDKESIAQASSPPAKKDGADVVETIDLSTPTPTAARPDTAAPPAAPPASGAPFTTAPPADTFRLRGFARARASAALLGENAVAGEPAALRVPWEPYEGQSQLFVELRYAHGKVFEATVSGLLEYDLFARTLYDPTTGAATQTTRSAYAATLREAYVGTTLGPMSLRIGQQRIAWGNSDAFPVNDVLDPRDTRDPVLVETELRYLPVFAARADFALSSSVELQLVAEPFFVSDDFDVYGTPWAVIQPTAPSPLRGLFGRANTTVDSSLGAALSPLERQTRLPPDDLSGASAGGKLAYTGEGFDAAVAYEYGLSHQPSLAMSLALQQQLAGVDWTKATPADLTPLLTALQTGQLASTYPRRHHVGAWAAKVVGPFVLRADAAFEDATVFLQPSLFGVVRPTVQGVAAVEWQSGEAGKTLLVEQYYQRILGDAPGPLLGAQPNTTATAVVARWTFGDHVETELRAVAGEAPVGFIVRPQIAYKTGRWELRGGVAWIDGEDGSLPQYYRRNTSAYVIGVVHF